MWDPEKHQASITLSLSATPVCFPSLLRPFGHADAIDYSRGVASSIQAYNHDIALFRSEQILYDCSLVSPSLFHSAFAHRLALTQTMSVSNPGDAAFSFTTCLHTYYRLKDVRKTTVTVIGENEANFSQLQYFDKLTCQVCSFVCCVWLLVCSFLSIVLFVCLFVFFFLFVSMFVVCIIISLTPRLQ
jgi:hypothetical protein